MVPAVLPMLAKAGFEIHIQSGAGIDAGYPDALYVEKGGKIVPDPAAVFGAADIIVQVLCYGSNDVNGELDVPLFDGVRFSSDLCVPLAWQSSAYRASGCDLICGGTDAAHYPRAEHGCAFIDGDS